MIEMKSYFTGFAVAALLAVGPALPGYAEDAPAAPAAKTESPPPSVARPSIVPKTTEPTSAPVANKAAEPEAKAAPDERPRHRHYARRHYWRNGYYRTAYWEPFPIFWPHFYRNRVHWSRVPWLFRF
jgi:hypothetical protein